MEVTPTETELHPLTHFDAVYIDACTWMAPEIETLLQQAAPALRSRGQQLIMTSGVLNELENCAPVKYAAQTALRIRERYLDYILTENTPIAANTADGEFVRLFFFNHRKRRQLLITHDQQLAADIQNICRCNEDEENPTAVMTLWSDGSLITFAEQARRKEQQARVRLEEMVGNSPLYIDSSTLCDEKLSDFLYNISIPMQAQEKAIRLVSNSLRPELQDTFTSARESYPGLLQVLDTDSTMSETDALLGALYLTPDNMDAERLILVTSDVARANDLRARRPKCDRFPYVDFMVINKYGFLSYLKLSEPTAPAGERKPPPPPLPRPKAIQQVPAERKPTAFIPQLIGAIKNDNIEDMCYFLAKGANPRNGIITALCQEKDSCLRALLETTPGNIEAGALNWWVIDYNAFAEPDYLAHNDEHFALLCKLIEKSEPLTACQLMMMTLADRVGAPNAAHERLWHIIRLALQKGAPAAVYSRATGETLPEIARRQGNTEMLHFLQSR